MRSCKSYLSLIIAGLFILSITACSNNKDLYPLSNKTIEATTGNITLDIVRSNNAFGFDLYKNLINTEEDSVNTFISPASIFLALSMTYNGADHSTRDAMAQVLHIKDIDLETLNQENKNLKNILLHADEQITLHIANSIWMEKGFNFKEDFIKRNKDFYQAEVQSLPFSDPKTTKIINDWVNKNTKGKISKIIDDNMNPLTVMFLINAIYFDGKWTNEFKIAQTYEADFTDHKGLKSKCDMMVDSRDFQYLKGDTFQAVTLPYGNRRANMYVFLPNEELTLSDFYEGLSIENWNQWMESFGKQKGLVGLPKVKLEYEKSLNDILKELGMKLAFDSRQADFGLMYDKDSSGDNIYIDNILHKTFLEIDEKGTKAAAITSVEMTTTSAAIEEGEKFTMIMDRPFFFVIRDDITGTILFMGSINEV